MLSSFPQLSFSLQPTQNRLVSHCYWQHSYQGYQQTSFCQGQSKLLFLILLNFSASFDSVDYSILFETYLGFCEDTVSCFILLCLSHFFSDTLTGSSPSSQPPTIGVLQGSIIECYLLSIYRLRTPKWQSQALTLPWAPDYIIHSIFPYGYLIGSSNLTYIPNRALDPVSPPCSSPSLPHLVNGTTSHPVVQAKTLG